MTTATAELLERYEVTDPADLDPVPKGYELIDGELVEVPDMGAESCWTASELYFQVRLFLARNPIAVAVTSDPGYRCFADRPRDVRKPDVAVMLRDPATYVLPVEDFGLVPDIVAEVVSPREKSDDTTARVEDFLAAGTRLAWVVYPRRRLVLVHRADGSVTKLRDPAELSGEDVLPGFAVPLAAFLPRVPAAPPA